MRSDRALPGSADVDLWREHGDVFETLAGIAQSNMRVTIDGESHDVNVARVQGDLFGMLGERAYLGRLLLPADHVSGAPVVAAVEAPVVVGVAPERFSRMLPSGILLPAGSGQPSAARHRCPMRVVGLLQPGTTTAQAHAMLKSRPTASTAWRAHVVPLRDSIVGADVGRGLKLLWGAVGLLLLVACANVTNLLLARLSDREREIAVLTALGAAAGLLLARTTRPLLVSLMPVRTPGLDAIAIDGRVLAFTLVATMLTVVLAGVWPVLRPSRGPADHALARRAGAGAVRGGTSRSPSPSMRAPCAPDRHPRSSRRR